MKKIFLLTILCLMGCAPVNKTSSIMIVKKALSLDADGPFDLFVSYKTTEKVNQAETNQVERMIQQSYGEVGNTCQRQFKMIPIFIETAKTFEGDKITVQTNVLCHEDWKRND